MKFLSTFLVACATHILFAQAGPIDFEPNGFGANWAWTTFENGNNPSVEIVANPSTSGVNLSTTVCKFTALVNGAPWAGFESVHGQGIGLFNLTAANCQVKVMVYKSVISPVGLKFATPSNASSGEILVSNTLVNQWEELTFDFTNVLSNPAATGIDQIIVFPDFNQHSDNNVCYIDNIKFSNQGGSQSLAPMVPAPTPTYSAASVISMFSNPYVNVTVDTWQAPWSQAQVTDLQIQGNDTKRYSSVNFAGIETLGGNQLDLSNMTHFRLDYWTANMNPFKIKLVDFGNDGQYAGGDDSESELSFQPVPQTWNTLEIPLSQFSSLNSISHFSQLIFSGSPAGAGVIFVDNVLFFDENQSNLNEVAAGNYLFVPNPSSDVIQIIGCEHQTSIEIYNTLGQLCLATESVATTAQIDIYSFKEGIYLIKLRDLQTGQTQTYRIEKK